MRRELYSSPKFRADKFLRDCMKYEYRILEIEDLKEGDKIDIPEGSLILSKHTRSEQGYIYDPDKPNFVTMITMLVPVKEGLVEM